MAAADVTRFVEALNRDAGLQGKVQAAVAGADDGLAAMVSVARAEGYDVSADELKEAVQQTGRELSESELGQVAGGFGNLPWSRLGSVGTSIYRR